MLLERTAMPRRIDACRACGSHDLVPVLDLGDQAYTGVFPRTREETVLSSPLALVKCHGRHSCGLLQLQHACDPLSLYGGGYGYRSGLNASMVRHLQRKVQRILSTVEVPERGIVLDIGSNDGTTLAAYPPGKFRRIGVDPTAPKFLQFYPKDVQIVPDFFSAANYRAVFGEEQAAVITSFSMLYDLEHPLEFMQEVHSVLSDRGVWVFEQSYLPLMLERNSYDTVCHEHVEYYSLSQLYWMAERAGFKLIDIEFNDINGGSSSVMAAKADSAYPESPRLREVLERERALGLGQLEVYAAFARRVEESRGQLRAFIEQGRGSGKTVAALGASTKGNVVLQYCGLTARDVLAIGEVNPDKFGAFSPGSLIPIVPEADVLAQEPDYLLVLPWHFRETFLAKPLRGKSRLVFPLPTLDVV
jgi:NDP-4-keto-2,6-dideoxyhexose 3-C-methyltransferase